MQINLKTEFKLINKGKSLLPKLIPLEIKLHLITLIFIEEILKVTMKPLCNKEPGPVIFPGETNQISKEQIFAMLCKMF